MGFNCYKGARDAVDKVEISKKGLAHVVVVKLLEMGNYLNKGHHLFLDNYFTNLPLADFLYSKDTFITGTIRKNRLGIPKELLGKFNVGEKMYMRSENMLGLTYREKVTQKTQVVLISTNSEAKSVQTSRLKRGRLVIKKKPQIIAQYNKNMGGVDSSDQMLYTYLDERRTNKYWKKVTLNILSRMLFNSYVLYKSNFTGDPMSRYNFNVSIIESLPEEWLSTKGIPTNITGGRDAVVGGYGLVKLPDKKEKHCAVCCKKRKADGSRVRRRSRTMCVRCKQGLHAECFQSHVCL